MRRPPACQRKKFFIEGKETVGYKHKIPRNRGRDCPKIEKKKKEEEKKRALSFLEGKSSHRMRGKDEVKRSHFRGRKNGGVFALTKKFLAVK